MVERKLTYLTVVGYSPCHFFRKKLLTYPREIKSVKTHVICGPRRHRRQRSHHFLQGLLSGPIAKAENCETGHFVVPYFNSCMRDAEIC